MARPPRQLPPSAIDGYKRLAKTQQAVRTPGGTAGALQVLEPVRSRSRINRWAGPIRLVGFAAVLAIIVGASVNLALADQRSPARTSGTQATPAASGSLARAVDRATAVGTTALSSSSVQFSGAKPADTPGAARSDRADPGAPPATSKPAPETAPAPSAVPSSSRSAPAARSAARSGSPLPFTGGSLLARPILGGAVLVLLGMLLQIAGQPLPARVTRR